jgi:bifunctional non-homologous end joining protein LigD
LVVEPMAAVTAAGLPADVSRWSFEYKWDGVRAIVRWDGRALNLYSRTLLDVTPNYPELSSLAEALGRHSVMLDGEIIAVDDRDRPSFAQLQRRMHVRVPTATLVADVPVYLVIFDLLHLDGRSTLKVPLLERRALLEDLTLVGPSWRVSPASVGEGQSLLDAARQGGLEGVMAKRIDSTYEPGRRSASWQKVKVVQRQEFVVGGWAPQEGTSDVLGTLQVGYYDRPGGTLVYAGSVGTGFDAATRRKLVELFGRLASPASPFGARLPRRDVRFVVPAVVAEVEYRRWPAGGLIQQAAYKGVRRDKPARDVVKECAV